MGMRGLQPPPPPLYRNFQIAIFGQKNQVIFGQNHLIIVQAMEKNIRARDFSPPKRKSSRTLINAVTPTLACSGGLALRARLKLP